MKVKDHIILAVVAICGWFFYYLIGIPSDYFQDWRLSEQILLSLITFFSAVPLISSVTIVLINRNYIKTGIWLAFYASFFLAFLDFIICGVIQRGGLKIFTTHWYLTLGYFYVWVICPLMGFVIHRFKLNMTNIN